MNKKNIKLLLIIPFLFSCEVIFEPNIEIYPKQSNFKELIMPWPAWQWTWIDKYYITSDLCKTADKFINELNTTFNNNVYYDAGTTSYNDVASHWLYNYDTLKLTTWIWWTWWWVALSNYCIVEWFWESSNASHIKYWNTQTLVFTMKEETNWIFLSEVLEKKDGESITIKWVSSKKISTKKISTPSFNSPFLYFENAPKEEIQVSIDSDFNNYKSIPDFNSNNSWKWKLDWNKISINWKENDKLFYELDLSQINLNRNWMNFSSKKELLEFLESSDFFNNMWFTKEQKQNTLDYILPQIQDSPYYYLTILSDNSVEKISQIDFSIKPDNFIRKYFAIYPTKTHVKISWDIIYPEINNNNNEFKIIETWEILVKPNMHIFWE